MKKTFAGLMVFALMAMGFGASKGIWRAHEVFDSGRAWGAAVSDAAPGGGLKTVHGTE